MAFFSVLFLGLKHCRELDIDVVMGRLPEVPNINGFVLVSPLVVVGGPYGRYPGLARGGNPCFRYASDFVLGILTGIVTSKRVRPFQACADAIKDALPVLGILVGVGMIIQVMTLTGVRGFIVISALSLPSIFLYWALPPASLSLELFPPMDRPRYWGCLSSWLSWAETRS